MPPLGGGMEIYMRNELPIEVPAIRSYLGDAFCFSIINSKAFSSGWVYDKYINLQYCLYDNQMKYADYGYYDFCPNEGVFLQSFNFVPNKSSCLINYIKEMINDGFYFFGTWNETLIPGAGGYSSYGGMFLHGCFIYGYDDEKRVFLTQGYKTDNIWGTFVVSYETFVKSVLPDGKYYLFWGYKVNAEYIWKFNIERMKDSLINYIKEDTYIESMNSYYGIEGCYKLFDHIEEQCFKLNSLHIPSIYNVYEHKTIMVNRIKFLLENKYIINRDLLDIHLDICNSFKLILNKCLKFNISNNSFAVNNIKYMAYENLDKEKISINRLINLLKDSHNLNKSDLRRINTI